MLHYDEFRSQSNHDFFEGSLLPSQEAHLFSMHWQSEAFWRALGVKLNSESKDSARAPSERSDFAIARDRHIQGLLDYLPHANPKHQALMLSQSLSAFQEYGLLCNLRDPYSFPLPRLLSDLGVGGISTMLEWGIALRRNDCHVDLAKDMPIEARALWLTSELVHEPYQSLDDEEADVIHHAAWLLLQYCLARTHRGQTIQHERQALLTFASHPQAKSFAGWSLIHVLDDLDTFGALVDCSPDAKRHPFGNPELNTGSLIWDTPTPDIITDNAWQILVGSEQRDKAHFAEQAARKNNGNSGKKIEALIMRFINQEPEAFFEVDLDIKGFKNLESLGMKREVLMKHPKASSIYAEVLFGRDLGL